MHTAMASQWSKSSTKTCPPCPPRQTIGDQDLATSLSHLQTTAVQPQVTNDNKCNNYSILQYSFQPAVSASVLMWQQLPLLVARAETHLQGRRQGWKNASERQGGCNPIPTGWHQAMPLEFRGARFFAITKPMKLGNLPAPKVLRRPCAHPLIYIN